MDDAALKKLQRVERKILEEVDRFCRENKIEYSLYAGTALGAVRHAGFIPWDDDIDIVMSRSNYNKFLKCWRKHPLPGYFLQNFFTDISCGINHTKIRKDDTVFLEPGEDEKKHCGIWIDIFVFDKVKDTKAARAFLTAESLILYAWTRGYSSRAYGSAAKKIFKKIVHKIPKNIVKRETLRAWRNIQRFSQCEENYHYIELGCFSGLKRLYPPNLLEQFIEIDFQGKKFMIDKRYHEMLKILYGDYMELPPKEERVWKHNPVKIEFGTEQNDARRSKRQ